MQSVRRALLSSAFVLLLVAGVTAVLARPEGSNSVTAHSSAVTLFDQRRPENPSEHDWRSVEVGVRIRSNTDGDISAVRFYKSRDNQGPHIGNLWSSHGRHLATAIASNETAEGWQTIRLERPVRVRSGQTFVASYHAPRGRYAADPQFFQKPTSAGPLTTEPRWDGATSVYSYGDSGFPMETWEQANYWVDVVFSPGATSDEPTHDDLALPPSTESTEPPTTAPSTAPTTAAPTTSSPTTVGPPSAPPTRSNQPPATAAPERTNGTFPANSVSAPALRPGSGITGVPDGVNLTPSRGRRITNAGAVIDAQHISGQVTIAAPNVLIKRSRFTGANHRYAVQVESGSVRIEDSEFDGDYTEAAVGFDNWTMVRSEITGVRGDAVKLGSNVLMEGNWVHDLRPAPEAHADGAQVQDGVRNTVVRNNTIIMDKRANAAIFIAPNFGPSTDGPLTIENNILGGGQYTVFVYDGDGKYVIRNITITGNRFVAGSATYGPVTRNVPVQAWGNSWLDSGGAVNF